MVPRLQKEPVQAHLRFANERQTGLGYDWEVLESDDTKIKLFGINTTRCVWRKRNAAYDPKNNTFSNIINESGNIMFWGCLSGQDTGQLHIVKKWMEGDM